MAESTWEKRAQAVVNGLKGGGFADTEESAAVADDVQSLAEFVRDLAKQVDRLSRSRLRGS